MDIFENAMRNFNAANNSAMEAFVTESDSLEIAALRSAATSVLEAVILGTRRQLLSALEWLHVMQYRGSDPRRRGEINRCETAVRYRVNSLVFGSVL